MNHGMKASMTKEGLKKTALNAGGVITAMAGMLLLIYQDTLPVRFTMQGVARDFYYKKEIVEQ